MASEAKVFPIADTDRNMEQRDRAWPAHGLLVQGVQFTIGHYEKYY